MEHSTLGCETSPIMSGQVKVYRTLPKMLVPTGHPGIWNISQNIKIQSSGRAQLSQVVSREFFWGDISNT